MKHFLTNFHLIKIFNPPILDFTYPIILIDRFMKYIIYCLFLLPASNVLNGTDLAYFVHRSILTWDYTQHKVGAP